MMRYATGRMPESLRDLLRQQRLERLLVEAETVCQWADSAEGIEEARRLVREAMVLFAVGRITHGEQLRVLAILAFAIEGMSER